MGTNKLQQYDKEFFNQESERIFLNSLTESEKGKYKNVVRGALEYEYFNIHKAIQEIGDELTARIKIILKKIGIEEEQ